MAKCTRCKTIVTINVKKGAVVVCSACLRKEIFDLKEKLESSLSDKQKEMFESFCDLVRIRFM